MKSKIGNLTLLTAVVHLAALTVELEFSELLTAAALGVDGKSRHRWSAINNGSFCSLLNRFLIQQVDVFVFFRDFNYKAGYGLLIEYLVYKIVSKVVDTLSLFEFKLSIHRFFSARL